MSQWWFLERQEIAGLPVAMFLVALYQDSFVLYLGAFVLWLVAYFVWSLWTLWRVSDRLPKSDLWRAVALLVYGGAGWLIALPIGMSVDHRLGAAIAFVGVFAPGVWAAVVARREPSAPAPLRRRWLLGGAVAVCALWVAAGVGLIVVIQRKPMGDGSIDRIASGLCGVAALAAATLAVFLIRNAISGFTPRHTRTAEEILADSSTP